LWLLKSGGIDPEDVVELSTVGPGRRGGFIFVFSLVLKEMGSGHRKGDGGFDIFLAFSMK